MPWTKGQGVIEASDGNVKVYTQEIASYTSGATFTLTSDDLVGELSDISGFGSKRDSKEINGYAYDSAVKKVGNAVPNDVQFTENLVTDTLDIMRDHYNDKDLLLTVIVDYTETTPEIVYACVGKISEWGMTLPLGDTTTLTYTMAIEVDAVPKANITLP